MQEEQYSNASIIKKNVAIFGSCVSRDVFNSQFNKNYKSHFEFTLLQNQTSILSLMSSAVKFDEKDLEPLQDWDLKMTKDELEKNFLKKLTELQPDILIVDFLADARFQTIQYKQSYITANVWKITKTPFYNTILQTNKPFTPKKSELIKHMKQFKSFIDKHLPNTKIILNQARAINSYIDNNGEKKYFNLFSIQRLNKRWALLDKLFIKIVNPYTICSMTPNLRGDISHPWGVGYVHYEKKFYQDFLRQLIELKLYKSANRQTFKSFLAYFRLIKVEHKNAL